MRLAATPISRFASAIALATLWGCTGPESPILPQNGPLVLEIRYPPDGARILQDSTSIWGTVGTGKGKLWVNGRRIPIEANGTFAGFVPLPGGETGILELVARRGREERRREVSILRGPLPEPEADPIRPYSRWVRMARTPDDTVDSATQARPIFTRWTPGGEVALPIDQGIRLFADRQADSGYRVRVAPDLFVWAARSEVDTLAGERAEAVPLGDLRIRSRPEEVEVSVAAPEPIPTSVESVPDGLVWTLFGGVLDRDTEAPPSSEFLTGLAETEGGPGRTELALTLAEAPLGWRVEWRDGRIALRIRTPLPLKEGLGSLVVALDPGHPPGGTIGPGGLREDSMTLAVARAAAQRLQALGAQPILMRTDENPVSLDERIARAERAGAHVFVSIHGNSPGPGRPPEAVFGTAVYWEQPNSAALGRAMLASVAPALGQPSLGLMRNDLAVIRPTWYPAVLVEGIGMVLPEREAYLRTPEGVAAYAEGIVNGLSAWVAGWAR